MENMRKIEIGERDYLFTERECIIIEKYFDSIRQFMDNNIVDIICSDMEEDDFVELVARYDAYLLENDYDSELEFSQIMFNEFGVDI